MNALRTILLPAFVILLSACIGASIVSNRVVADFESQKHERKQALLLTSETEIAALDLSQQMAIAHVSYYQLIISTIGTAASIAGIIILLYSLRQTREALQDNKRFGIAQTCAYLHVESVETSDLEGWILNCKNTGNSPALDVMVTSFIKSATSPINQHFTFPDDRDHNSGAIAAGETRRLVIRAPLVEAIAETSGSLLLISGSVKYSDVFGTRYKSEFAAYRSSGCDQKFLIPAVKLAIHKRLSN